MVRLRYKIALVVAVLAGVLVWVSGYRHGKTSATTDGPNPAAILPSNDKEQLIINPKTHQLIILQSGQKNKIETLPDRISKIDILKNGDVKVTAQQFGFESHPFIGIGLGQGVRGYIGDDLLYLKKVDLGLGVVTPRLFVSNPDLTDIRAGVFASYNFWSNTRVTFGVDHTKKVNLLLSVRL